MNAPAIRVRSEAAEAIDLEARRFTHDHERAVRDRGGTMSPNDREAIYRLAVLALCSQRMRDELHPLMESAIAAAAAFGPREIGKGYAIPQETRTIMDAIAGRWAGIRRELVS